jgi:hypothetical protein
MSASLSKIPSRLSTWRRRSGFQVAGVSPIHADALDRPVDLAPAIIETSDTNWAANTTLDVEADFYAPTPVQGDRAHGGRMEPWSRSDACGLPAGTGSAASG